MEALSDEGGPLHLENFGQSVGGLATDVGAMYALSKAGSAMLPAGGIAGLPLLRSAPMLGRGATWLAENPGMGALYGQLLENKPEEGAVAGFTGGLTASGLGALAKYGAPFFRGAAEKSLGRVVAPGKEAWKKFVGKNAEDIIRDVPLSAASPFAEGGGLQGIEAFADQQGRALKTALDDAYANAGAVPTPTGPILQGIRDLRSHFGQENIQGQFVSNIPAYTAKLDNLIETIEGYGSAMTGDQLRKVARDWGDVVAGAKGTGFILGPAEESAKGALLRARGVVEGARDTHMERLMGSPAVKENSDELSYWIKLGEAANSTVERRTGHQGGGLIGQMAVLAGLGTGGLHGAGHGVAGMIGAGVGGGIAGGAVGAAAGAVGARVLKSPFWNLLMAKTKLKLADALASRSVPAITVAMRRVLLELSLLDHGGLKALGHQDLTSLERLDEHENLVSGRGVTPGVLDRMSPAEVYTGGAGTGSTIGAGASIDPNLDHKMDVIRGQDEVDGRTGRIQDDIDAATSDQEQQQPVEEVGPQSQRQQLEQSLRGPAATAGLGAIPAWLEKQLVQAPDLGAAHPHLQKLANLIAEQTTPLNVAFLGDEALRPLAAGTKVAGAAELVGKGLAAAMAAAGLHTGVEGVQEGRPGKVIAGGTQALLGSLGLRSGGVARAGAEGAEALGGFTSRLGRGLRGAGKQAVIGPAIALGGTAMADTDLAKALIPDDETRHATFGAVSAGLGLGALGVVAGRALKAGEVPTVEVGGREIKVARSPAARRAKDQFVTLDMGKLDAAWEKAGGGWRVEPGGEVARSSGAIEGRYQGVADYLKDGTELYAPEITVREDGTVGFTNGRHRTAYLRDQGVTEMPVTMSKESVANARATGLLPPADAAVQSKRVAAVQAFRDTLTDEQHAALVEEIKAAFPPKDKFTKPMHPMQPKGILKKGEELSPEAQEFLAAAVTGVPPKGTIAPLELHAMIEGKEYAPKRLIREPLPEDYDYSQQIKGAPLGVQTAEHEQAALDRYMNLAENGLEGAKWYVRGGKTMLSHVGDDPVRARELSAGHSITSSATSINVNSPFAIKGWIQRQVGRAIKTGRYPKAMSKEYEKVFRGESDVQKNLKRGAFYNEINEAGGFAEPGVVPRPTNDIWQSEAWGYANVDGTPHRSSVTPDMHAWMDRMTQQAVDRANAEGLGGRHDWTLGEMQAAAWTGIRNETMTAAGKKIPGYYDFGTGLETSYGQGGREALAHPTTGHLKGLNLPENRKHLDLYDQKMYEATHDEQGRDLISLWSGGLTGKSLRGPGNTRASPRLACRRACRPRRCRARSCAA